MTSKWTLYLMAITALQVAFCHLLQLSDMASRKLNISIFAKGHVTLYVRLVLCIAICTMQACHREGKICYIYIPGK